MTTFTFVRLIFLKDVRATRYPLLLLLAFMVASIGLSLDFDPRATLPTWIWFCFPGIGIFLLTITVVARDSAGREFRFLLTRPVPSSAIGLAKLLFLTLFVILPYWIGQELVLAVSRIPLSLLDHVLFSIEIVVQSSTALAFLVLLSVFPPNVKVVSIVVMGMVAVVSVSLWQLLSFDDTVIPPWDDPEHKRLVQFRTFFAAIIFIVSALLAIGIRYRTRDFKVPFAIAVSGITLSYLTYCLFPYDLARPLENQTNDQSGMTPNELDRVHMIVVQPKASAPSYNLNGGTWNDIHYVYLNQSVQFEGLEPPYFVRTLGYHSVVTLRSGKTFTSNFADFRVHGAVGGLYAPSLLRHVAGISSPRAYTKEMPLDLLTYLPKNLPKEDVTGATVKGVITLEVRRAYVSGAIPIKAYASYTMPRRRYEITSTDFSPDRVHFKLNTLQLRLSLRGDLNSWETPDDLDWLLVYRPFGETLDQDRYDTDVGQNLGVKVVADDCFFRLPSRKFDHSLRPFPPDWASNTELIFFRSDLCGQISCPYEIDNVDLRQN